jgi:hypothetical protein
LKFAQQSGVPIIPVMMEPNFAAKKWLGILTAGSIWTPMYKQSAVDAGIENLIVQMQLVVPDMSREGGGSGASESGSEAGDVEAWADSLFSYREMREELERLKLVELGSSVAQGGCSSLVVDGLDEEQALFSLPALVPKLAAGLLVSSTMDAVLSAVLSDKSPAQIGFCGMGGIGKTTVSSWLVRDAAIRRKFKMLAWVSLGQTPVLTNCMELLYLQLTGHELERDLAEEPKQERLKQAFANKSILLVLDDCWDHELVAKFSFVDDTSNSKVLISSRVRDVLEGGRVLVLNINSVRGCYVTLVFSLFNIIAAQHCRVDLGHCGAV